ncbi:MAG: hypothetical protein M1839_005797 [Geoglossum umbratile]|nr:MAG: hypothetical protein M1839_005797 [Geoglossum umbratile]
MAEALAVFGVVTSVVQIVDLGVSVVRRTFELGSSIRFFTKYYNLAGVVLWVFGSPDVWRMQLQVLASMDDRVAMDFKKSMQDESSIVAVAGTILAQIAITALSLTNLSQTHWTARAFFTFSLVSSIMAVSYATNQYRVLGRFLQAHQIKAWIKNDKDAAIVDDSMRTPKEILDLLPSTASVLRISAPEMLLSASLNFFLIGLGTRNLDELAGANDSRAVFITYVVSLTVCYGINALSDVAVHHGYTSGFDYLRNGIEYVQATQGKRHAEGASDGGDGPFPAYGPIKSLTWDLEASPVPHSASSGAQKRPIRQASTFQGDSTYLELAQALYKAAKLRRESAEADELIAQLYEHLGQTQFGGDDKITRSADNGD